ncbi:MAG TPA: hypothetical protein VGQ11_02710 [Candidatus Acidoferrales bacterium]|jgi:hypothetical protein|nr:hypothetical protein [Candidatus Acidoferrales bacterium]
MSFKTVNSVNLPGDRYKSAVKENTANIRTTKGRLLNIKASNLSTTTDLYLQIHDKATPVQAGDIPVLPIFVGRNGYADLTDIRCELGIQVALSTTPDTYTAPGVASGWFYAESK